MDQIAGIDGCRDGWVVVRRGIGGGTPQVEVFADLRNVFADPSLVVIAVDVPIGLLDAAVPGGRACDVAARRFLGPKRAGSVFSAPVRVALAAECYVEAAARSRASSHHRLALSQQSFAIVPKIAEVDALIAPEQQDRIVEVHPECCFAAMNGGSGLAARKKTLEGRAARLLLLSRCWAPDDDLAGMVESNRSRGVARDDVIDAMAACWTAERAWRRVARRLPGDMTMDGRGLRMEIWV